jgi:two-component system, sensor histidine kinase and response regulator
MITQPRPADSRLVLLAEDHPINQRVATLMLEHLGFCVDVVADGAEAVRAAARNPYCAIFMDCEIPVVDGYEATATIRDAEGARRRTPIVALTASDRERDRARCLAAGMDDYLTKPISVKALAAVMARLAPERSGGTDRSEPTVVLEPTEPPLRDPFAPADTAEAFQGSLDSLVVAHLQRLGNAAGEDLVGQLIVLFLADAEVRRVALREAFAAGDAAGVGAAAHTLSGASSNLGASDLAALCAALEIDARGGRLESSRPLLHSIEIEIDRLRMMLSPEAVAR